MRDIRGLASIKKGDCRVDDGDDVADGAGYFEARYP